MARRSALSRSFKSDSQLSQFFLDGVTATGKVLGVGSYGSVVEVVLFDMPFLTIS